MKKIKKILLALAPLSAIAIATPIVLTACSDTTSNTLPPDDNNKPTNPPGDGSQGDNDGTKPSFDADKTNNKDFKLEANSEAQKILDEYQKAKGENAANKVLDDALKGFPKKDSEKLVENVLTMWSNNNWFYITNNAQDEKVKSSFISNLKINKVQIATEGKASFNAEYKVAFKDSNGKFYEATQLLKADDITVDATTKIDIPKQIPSGGYKIDGKEQTLPSTSIVESITDPKTNLENNLKQKNVSLDAKQVFQTFITNHNINFAPEEQTPSVKEGTWLDGIKSLDDSKTKLDKNKTQVDVFLTAFSPADSWNGLKKGSTQTDIRKAIYTANGNVNNLNDTFKNLIAEKNLFKEFTVVPSATSDNISFAITLKKISDSSTKTLKINVKFA